jgi:putative endonuclease
MGPRDKPEDDGGLGDVTAVVRYSAVIAVYIMASRRNGTIYIGVTSDLHRRVYEHREGVVAGFTKTYACKRLVWFETFETITGAIRREKALKRWPRDWKCNLIERINPVWGDLYEDLVTPKPPTYRPPTDPWPI